MENYRGKKVLIVGLGKTSFVLINFFNKLECQVKVTDIRPIFDLNKPVKRVRKIQPSPELVLGEHREEDFLEADLIIYSPSVDPHIPQLEIARHHGKEVYSEFTFSAKYCDKPVIAICGSYGRTTIAHMISFMLKVDKKNVFVGGTSEEPFINYHLLDNKDEIDYVIVELSPQQIKSAQYLKPMLVVYPNLDEIRIPPMFRSVSEYIETCLSVATSLNPENYLILNFDKLASLGIFKDMKAQTCWYSRRSFVKMGVIGDISGTHFHEKRIHSNVHYHSEFKVNKMRIIGTRNRENLMAAITACKALKVSDEAIQECIIKFPGIPHRLEYIIEKNGVKFYNDSKSESMNDLKKTLESFKQQVIVIAGGKDTEQEFEGYQEIINEKTRLLVIVGECKEALNRSIGDATQTYLVGSFDESVLIAYQKSRNGDIIVLCPGNSSTDVFRDYVEKGNYYKKLVYQL